MTNLFEYSNIFVTLWTQILKCQSITWEQKHLKNAKKTNWEQTYIVDSDFSPQDKDDEDHNHNFLDFDFSSMCVSGRTQCFV